MQNFPGAPPPSPITKLLSINLLHFGPLISICFAISDSLRCVLRGLIMQNFPGAPPPSPITKLLSKFNTFWAFNFYLFCYF